MTLVAAVQTMGIDCPVDLDIEEEDEMDNHELSLGARFLMGIVFGSLLFGFVSGLLLASGSQGLLPQKWHGQPFGIIMAEVFHQETSLGDVKEC